MRRITENVYEFEPVELFVSGVIEMLLDEGFDKLAAVDVALAGTALVEEGWVAMTDLITAEFLWWLTDGTDGVEPPVEGERA